MLAEVLPSRGRKIEMILAGDLIKKTEFTIEEISEFELRDHGDGGVTWNASKDKEVVFDLSDEQAELLRKQSARMDEEGKVTRENLSLLQKIDKL